MSLAAPVNRLGNRHRTFRENRRRSAPLELLAYGAISVAGVLVALACVWTSRYALRLDSLLADNVSKNVFGLGLGLGLVLRFASFRYWVCGSTARASCTSPTSPKPAPRSSRPSPRHDRAGAEPPAPHPRSGRRHAYSPTRKATVPAPMARPLVVIHTYDETGDVRTIVAKVLVPTPEARVLVVDDGTTDGTGDIAYVIASVEERVHVIHRSQKSDLGAAYVAA
ncbi:glycosyltransferase [Clavibacter michiganensis subsp. phaseoli]|uniref:Glycosyltransferase n=1 Tax=Clavibacter phaseoli TaxID=1734031 RepID=A0A8I0VAF1_9MICO|nr:glycosyltransferase [Clavibacter phaseoli]